MPRYKICTNKTWNVASLFVIIVVSLYILYTDPKATHSLRLWKGNILFNNGKRCVIILREHSGRLGNRLFMFASAYGLSLNRSCQLYIDSDIINELYASFEIHLPNLLPKSQLNHSTPIQKIYNHCSFFPYLLHSNNSYSIELLGYWQVHTYFIDHIEEIRRQLRFKRTILDQVNSFLDKHINRSVSTLVGIHIRRGDFLLVRRVSSNKYIFNAMLHFLAKYRSVIFVIVSDDKQYCRKVFGQRNNVLLTPDSFSAADDLATLTLCEHIILTAGTFGWWGAFLLHNRVGDVITDSKPDHSPLDNNCRRDDYFPPWYSFLNNTN
jgi:galactoside 2-L-fucosyltransferase 1/2